MTIPSSFNTTDPENGNVLIYVIGAIFLLGLLIVIVRGSAQPGQNIDQETLILKASQVRQYASELERGIRFVFQNGHSETEIRFAHPNHSSAYGDLSTDTPFTRQVFHRDGGGVEWRDNDSDIQTVDTDWVFNGSAIVRNVGTNGMAGIDLVAILPYVSREFCLTINDSIGIDDVSGEPPQDSSNADITSTFVGSFAGPLEIGGANLDYAEEACIEGDVDPVAGTYHYYKVLLVR